MAQIVRFTDDLDGTEHDEAGVKRGVVITVDGRKGKKPLDLTVATYEALVALSDGDATRFAPCSPRSLSSTAGTSALRKRWKRSVLRLALPRTRMAAGCSRR